MVAYMNPSIICTIIDAGNVLSPICIGAWIKTRIIGVRF